MMARRRADLFGSGAHAVRAQAMASRRGPLDPRRRPSARRPQRGPSSARPGARRLRNSGPRAWRRRRCTRRCSAVSRLPSAAQRPPAPSPRAQRCAPEVRGLAARSRPARSSAAEGLVAFRAAAAIEPSARHQREAGAASSQPAAVSSASVVARIRRPRHSQSDAPGESRRRSRRPKARGVSGATRSDRCSPAGLRRATGRAGVAPPPRSSCRARSGA